MPTPIPQSLNAVETLIDLIQFRRDTVGERVFMNIIGDDVTFAELAEEVDAYATAFRQRGIAPGDRVAIALPTCKEFLFAYFGAQRAGAIPAPLYPNSTPTRVARIVENCGARMIFGTGSVLDAAQEAVLAVVPDVMLVHIETFTIPETIDVDALPRVQPDDIAFLQYTSGSTGVPKGVILTHRHLLANMRSIIERMQHNPEETGVSFLPLYHDMGLIGFIFCPLYSASKIVVLPAGLRNPKKWLEAITQHKAQFTGAPDIAYRLCSTLPDLPHVDLSSLRIAYSGGEPVRAPSVRAFEERFGLHNVVAPSYGLAETSLCVSTTYPGTTVYEDANGFVSCGRPIAGTLVEIRENGVTRPPHAVGEIVLKAPSNTTGYWGREDEMDELFTEDGFLRTGDLGYLDRDGNLFIVGRKKHIIIRGGENIAPQELEQAADDVEGIRFSAAVGCELDTQGGGEQILIFAEVRLVSSDPAAYVPINQRIRIAIRDRLGFFPNQVYLVRPRTIPRTPNGKIQHGLLRDAFLDGQLAAEGKILFPMAPAPAA